MERSDKCIFLSFRLLVVTQENWNLLVNLEVPLVISLITELKFSAVQSENCQGSFDYTVNYMLSMSVIKPWLIKLMLLPLLTSHQQLSKAFTGVSGALPKGLPCRVVPLQLHGAGAFTKGKENGTPGATSHTQTPTRPRERSYAKNCSSPLRGFVGGPPLTWQSLDTEEELQMCKVIACPHICYLLEASDLFWVTFSQRWGVEQWQDTPCSLQASYWAQQR